MADVLIVCVREDEPQAKALAEMFEAAGFSVGGAPSNDAALRGSGAGLVVWSQASIRSRPFLDAAQRVINAQKAVVASLIEPPPPSSIGDSPAFDLSRWNGDPNDPSLDPLFFAVDRMVNTARAEVTAPASQQRYEAPAPRYEPPPTPRTPPAPPPYARAPQRAPEPPPQRSQNLPPGFQMRNTRAPAGDALGSEAEHWRAIRNSNDPADFMDYLARYGEEGAFADVAELRLKQLTAPSEPQRPAVRTPPPPPQVRLDPPPSRRAEAPPPQRRPDPPPQRRREPTYERNYNDRPPEAAPKEGGGALRAFILIALLGGAALAGGLYFGGGMPNLGGDTKTGDINVSAPPPVGEPADASDVPANGNDSSVGLSDAAVNAPTAQERRQPTAEEQRRDQQRREQQRQEQAQQRQADTTVPSPSTSWAGNTQTGTGGPISLRPGEQASNTPSVVVPISPDTTTQIASNDTTTTATQPRTTVAPGRVTWTQRPSATRIAQLYPNRALRENVGGRVELNCVVRPNLSLECSVASETPGGLGFGAAAQSASGSYRARPTLSNGDSAVGTRTRIAIQFQAPAQQ